MAEINFEERAVAFIDVLGFSSLVKKAVIENSKREQLQFLVSLLEDVIPILGEGVEPTVPKHLVPKHIYISDSIILSAPINDQAMKHYSGLEIVVMRAIQLTHRFLEAGYLLRGGISVGKVWHGESNIVGPAYEEAYEIQDTVCKPCILLSESALRLWKNGFGASSRMCVLNQGSLMVNGLHDFYVPDKSHGGIERAYEKYTQLVEKQINSSLPKDPKAKWKWFSYYLKREKKLVTGK